MLVLVSSHPVSKVVQALNEDSTGHSAQMSSFTLFGSHPCKLVALQLNTEFTDSIDRRRTSFLMYMQASIANRFLIHFLLRRAKVATPESSAHSSLDQKPTKGPSEL